MPVRWRQAGNVKGAESASGKCYPVFAPGCRAGPIAFTA
jgi:hypothetical protein